MVGGAAQEGDGGRGGMIAVAAIAAAAVVICAFVASRTIGDMHRRSLEHEAKRFKSHESTELEARMQACEDVIDEAVARVRKAGLGEGLTRRRRG